MAFFMRIRNLFRKSENPTLDTLVDLLSSECSEFLSNPVRLWRGVQYHDEESLYQEVSVRKDRRSLSGRNLNTFLFNKIFQDKYGVPNIRDQSVFCSNDLDIARTYGIVWFVFPKNGSKVACQPEIKDSYGLLGIMWQEFMERLAPAVRSNQQDLNTVMKWVDANTKLEKSPNDWLEGLLNSVSDESKQAIQAAYDHVKNEIFPEYSVTPVSSIPTASTPVEYMIFDTDSFVMVSPQTLSEQEQFKRLLRFDYDRAWDDLIKMVKNNGI